MPMDSVVANPSSGRDSGTSSTLFDLLPVGAYRSTPQGRMLRANAALVRFNGYGSEQELLERCTDVAREWYVDPNQRARFVELLERDGQLTGFVSEVVRHRTRERVWVTENAHVVRDAQGEVLYYEGTIEEITDRVRAQAALQRSEAHLRLITNQLPGMVFRVRYTPQGQRVFDFVSEGSRSLFGLEPQQLMQDSTLLEALRHPEDRERVAEAIRGSVREAQPLTIEFRILLPEPGGPHLKWLQVTSAPVGSQEAGSVRIGVMIDITAQRQAAELRAERDRAASADQAKTQLLSRVSHELRTPLNAVLGFGQLLDSDADLAPRHRSWIRQILASGQHLLELVDDVLDLSSAQAGQLNLSLTAVALQPVIAEAWAMLDIARTGAPARPAGRRFVDDTAAAPPLWVHADPRRLKQVLSNLFSNAIKYNRAGGEVRVSAQVLPEGFVELRVADTGRGMTADQLLRLFQPFERLGAQHTNVQGTGLGLALCKQLAEAMGGRIDARSQPGVGSVFAVRLQAWGSVPRSESAR